MIHFSLAADETSLYRMLHDYITQQVNHDFILSEQFCINKMTRRRAGETKAITIM